MRERYWRAWEGHCRLFPLNERGPNLPPYNIEDMLLTFALAMWEGQYGLGGRIQVQSVKVTLRAVAQKYILDGHCDPRHASPAQHSLNLPIARLLKKFKEEDPPPQPKLAIPVSTIQAGITKYNFSPHHAAVADLVVVAFFYLLSVDEYTAPWNNRPKRTFSLRKCNAHLWRKGQLLNYELGLSTLVGADSATILIANTKNGKKGAFVHHDAFGGNICPVAALARRIANLRGMRASTPLSTVCHPPTPTTRISDRDVTITVQWGATYDCLVVKGYTVDLVSSHSLRAGGAMAMKPSGATDSTIMRISHWTSLT